MNVLLCLSHSIEEYDQLRLLHSLGYGVASIGGYIDPAHPHDDKRPALPEIPMVAAVKAAVDGLGTPDNLGVAQSRLPDPILEWLGDDGAIVYHHHLYRLFGQWRHVEDWLRGSSRRRVIWRTVGQSLRNNELEAAPFRDRGLEIVRYSPKERSIPGYAGEDALIRFYKDPADWEGWMGDEPVVLNIAQHDATPHARDQWLNWGFWEAATDGLPAVFAGPHTEKIGGLGTLSLDEMQTWLRRARCYLYTGTQPASYTLGLIEAMMAGIPVVSIGPGSMWFPDLFEGHEIVGNWYDDPAKARESLRTLLEVPHIAAKIGAEQHAHALALFGRDTIAAQWREFLG